MSGPRKSKSLWDWLSDRLEEVELVMRMFNGGIFAFLAVLAAWWFGTQVLGFVSLGVGIAVVALPIGFVFGFFWTEIRLFGGLLGRLILGIFH